MSPESKMLKLSQLQGALSGSEAVKKRLDLLFDEGTFVELDSLAKVNESGSGVVTGYGYVEGTLVYAFAQDSAVASGALGRVHAAKIKKIYELAAKTGCPVVAMYDSNGVRIDEGNEALSAYGELLACQNNLSGVVPQIAVVTGVCAGCSAMLCCGADYVVMGKDAQLFMTAPFTAKAKGDHTPGAGTADNAAKSGVAHIVADTEEDVMAAVKELVSFLPSNNLSMVPVFEYAENPEGPGKLTSAYGDLDSVSGAELTAAIADQDSVLELQSQFGSSYTALARVQGSTVGFAYANGALSSADCAKLARFARTCDAFAIPVVTMLNTEGFVPSAAAELAGSIRESAQLAHAYAEATCPKIGLILGKAVGPAYIALAGKGANADAAIAWPGAVISPLPSETAVEFLWHDKLAGSGDLAADRAALVEEYNDTLASAFTAAADGVVDMVIDPAATRTQLINTLEMLAGKRVSSLPKKHSNMPL